METVIALGLLSLGAVGLATGFSRGLRAQEGALAQRAVLQAVADAGELLRASPAAAREGVAAQWSASLLRAVSADAEGWRLRTVREASAAPAAGGWEALVTWRDRLGTEDRRLHFALGLQP